MKLFQKKFQEHEALPDVITSNGLIQRWHSNADGALAFLVVNASAKSAENLQRFWLRVVISFVGCWIGGVVLKNVLIAPGIGIAGPGIVAFWCAFLVFWVLVIWLSKFRNEKRICTITTTHLTIERWQGVRTYALTQVVGVQRHAIDQQRIDEERRRYRRQRDPRLMQPYSSELMLETDLGQVSLGAVFGLEEARDIANSLNTAIQFMKGRSSTGAGPVVDPRFQYRHKTAGRIPD